MILPNHIVYLFVFNKNRLKSGLSVLHSYVKLNTIFSLLPMLLFYVGYGLYKPIYCNLYQLPGGIVNDTGVYDYYPFLDMSERFDSLFFEKAFHRILQYPKCLVLDFVAMIPYLLHGFIFFICSLKYACTCKRNPYFFAFVNICGYSTLFMLICQYFVPVAPPWFVENYYGTFNSTTIYQLQCTSPSQYHLYMDSRIMAGNFYNIDKLTGFWIFQYIYTHSVILFGALPSMHVGLALSILETEHLSPNPNKLAALYSFWMAWAAVYSNHHYILDIILAAIIVRSTSLLYSYYFGLNTTPPVKNSSIEQNNSFHVSQV